jgi:hypothetical protein
MSMMYAFNHALWPSFSGTYGGIARGPAPSIGSIAGYYANDLPKPAPSPYDSLKHKIRQLKVATPAKIADPTPPAPAKCPDYVGTLTGWRGWEVSGGLLEALGTDFTWEPRRAMRARCKREEHIAPSKKCACGFWSFKTSELLTKALVTYADHVSVIGTVEIWGRVIECKNGFRSEYSYPKELWLLEDGLESLSWRYGVPVRKL